MDAVLASTIDILEDVVKLPDWQHELAFTEPRHTESINGLQSIDGSWRLKERVKTVSVALVLCLNVGVDPPDVVKIEPAAHLECWFDPLSEEPQKAIEYISVQLEKQYEQWHSRARYKKCLDPTVDEVKRLCTSMRRYSKEDRVLFHYNGHGVPRPTLNGEIWVFNEKYTQYIPLAIYDLQQWMGAPSIYVFDCSCAGSIVDSFLEFAKQHKKDYEMELAQYNAHQQRQILVNSNNNMSQDNNNLMTLSSTLANVGQQQHQNNLPTDKKLDPDMLLSQQQQQQQQQHNERINHNGNLMINNIVAHHQNQDSMLQSTTTTNDNAASSVATAMTTSTNLNPTTSNTTATTTNNLNHPTNNLLNNNINSNIIDASATTTTTTRAPPIKPPNYENCFHLAACEAHQILPMQPDLPADLFTSCLTTPIKMALRWFVQKNDSRLIPKVTFDLIDKIPGSLSDRKTMLGELNWIFTAITDTIAWDVLPRELFQRLYRQDLLVASLFRNFLLADRIMRTYDCTPVSHPKLPKTYHHPMWRAWDMVVDLCLSQLVDVLDERVPFRTSTFFAEQLTAFEVWLDMDHSSNQRPDHQLLPIILQVLLSPVHRLRALDLLSRFLNLGPQAVNSALSVGIFPYVLKLLQSNAREVRPFLLSIWAKILAIDRRCQVDLVRDHYHRYFLTILSDSSYDAHYRTMAAFVLTCIVRDYPLGQELAYQANLIAFCLEQLDDSDSMLRKWLAICLGCSWDNYDDARWCGVRSCAHEKLYSLLDDPDPEVRAASVYALGTFINSSSERTDHANTIDHSIGMKLVSTSLNDSSVLVRHELVVALQYLVLAFESQFIKLEQAARDEERKQNDATTVGHELSQTYHGNNLTLSNHHHHIPRVNSLSAIPLLFGSSSKIVSNVYHVIWKTMYTLAADPHPRVSSAAQTIVDDFKTRSYQAVMSSESLRESKSNSSISDSSSPNRSKRSASGSDHTNSGPTLLSEDDNKSNLSSSQRCPIITTDYVDWCTKYFVDPEANYTSPCGSSNNEDQQREWRMLRVLSYRNVCLRELMIIDQSRFNDTVSNYKIQQVPNLVAVHPYDPIMVVAGLDDFSVIHSDGPHVNDYDSSGLSASISSASLTTTSTLTNSSSTLLGGSGGSSAASAIINGPNINMGEISNNHHYPHHHPHHNQHHLHTGSNIHPHHHNYLHHNHHNQHHPHYHINGLNDSHNHHHHHQHNSSHDLIGTQSNCHSSSTSQITSLQLINPEYNTLVSTGSSDGTVRIWRAYNGLDYSFNPQLVSAFHLMPELQPYRQGLGMILLWDQHQSRFYATSDQNDVRIIKVWDAQSESKIQDIPTCAEFGVSCLSSDGEHSIAAGFLDGSIRIYDTRLKKTDCRTFTFRKHSEKILTLHMFKPGEKHINLVSGDSGGEVRFWDKRAPTSVKRVDVGQKMSVMSVHPNADVFACGLKAGHGIKIYNLDGTSRAGCVIKPQDNNFFNSRHNPSVSSLAFHPLTTSLVAGYTDAVISVYSSRIVP